MTTQCSHVLLKVEDLHQAVRDYRELGFQVDYATAEDKAQHAHVWFTEGPIIELLTTPRHAKFFKWSLDLFFGRGAGGRMVRWAQESEGLCDVAVVIDSDDLSERLGELRAAGVPSGRTVKWTRERPDGQKIRFQFSYPRDGRLPFLVTPYDPPQHPTHVDHPNGATGLRSVRMGVRAEDRLAFERITGGDPLFRVEAADTTRVLGIEISGLNRELDSRALHGGVLVPALK